MVELHPSLRLPDPKLPLNQAPITLCEGTQGKGKNLFCVSEAVDLTFANATSIKLTNGQIFNVSPVLTEKGYPIIGKVIVHLPHKDIMANCPVGSCVIADGVRIYGNFHFFGIRAAYLTIGEVINYLNEGLISHAYLYLDEHYLVGNAREWMSPQSKAITQLTNQMRKGHIHLTYITPFARQIDTLERASVYRNVLCENYNPETHMATYSMKQEGQHGAITREYYAATYFPYYLTDEKIQMSKDKIGRAIEAAR